MKSENQIRLFKESLEKNIADLWDCLQIHTALEEEIKLRVIKWVLDEPVEE